MLLKCFNLAISCQGEGCKWLLDVTRFHTRRANWHPGNCDSDNIGFLVQETLAIGSGNVAFNDVVIDDCSMAGDQIARNLMFLLNRFHCFCNAIRYLKSLSLQMLDPAIATAAGCTAIDRYLEPDTNLICLGYR